MRFNHFIAPLVLLPVCALSQPQNDKGDVFLSKIPTSKNAFVKSYSSESAEFKLLESNARSIDYPTQIIRVSVKASLPQSRLELKGSVRSTATTVLSLRRLATRPYGQTI